MTASLSTCRTNFETSSSIYAFTPASYIMFPGGRGDGDRRTGSYNQGSSHGNQQPGLVPAYADTTSRRRTMNIEDILNPSDENTRRHQQPRSSGSYEAERTAYRNHGSILGNRAPRSGPHSQGGNATARSRGGSGHLPPHRGSGLPDVPLRTRPFRPSYTDEEEHFIWYLRIDVRICRHKVFLLDFTLEH